MPEPLLEVSHIKKSFAVGRGLRKSRETVRAVDDVSLLIRPGETLGLVGESGSGKTTLAKLILGLLPPTEGSIRIDGTDIRSREYRTHHDVGAVFQDPASSLNPRATVYRSLERPLTVNGVGKADARELIYETVEKVNLRRELLDRFPHELSGGQQQRVSIARAIMLRPKLLVLDEPTSALDVSVQAQTLNELLALQKKFGLAYLFITHNLSVVRYMSDRICVMYAGKVMEMGEAEAVYGACAHPYTLSLLSSVPPLHPRERNRKKYLLSGDMPSLSGEQQGCRFAPRCPFAREACRSDEPAMKDMGADHEAACLYAGELDFWKGSDESNV